MLIIEIILTIFAWKKGWNWYSLIPLCLAFLIGLIVGLSGGLNPSIILIDVMAIIALIFMVAKGPTSPTSPPNTKE